MDYKLPERFENSNKSDYGRVVNVAGSDYMSGAAYLSSVSALKSGCGYCYLVSSERVINAVSAQTQNVVFAPLSKLEQYLDIADVVEIGCGLSTDDTALNSFKTVISVYDIEKPLIIDADGLNLLSQNSELFIERKFKNVVLTPHPKEASRLLGVSSEDVLNDIESAAFEISKKYSAVTVLKTHNTVVADFSGRKYVNNTGNNAMAKAGSGDVLTGMISGITAQGADVFTSSVLGVILHGLCGDLARKDLTEYSVMADDLIDYIPAAFKYYLKNY